MRQPKFILIFFLIILGRLNLFAECEGGKWTLTKIAKAPGFNRQRDFFFNDKNSSLEWCGRKGLKAYKKISSIPYKIMRSFNIKVKHQKLFIYINFTEKLDNRNRLILYYDCGSKGCAKNIWEHKFIVQLGKKINLNQLNQDNKIQVLSDVDDTIICSLKDKSCNKNYKSHYWLKKGSLYPGALDLQYELARNNSVGLFSKPPLGLILLSARFVEPYISRAYKKGIIPQTATKMGWKVDGIMHGTFFKDQLINIFNTSQRYKALGRRKLLNFNALLLPGSRISLESKGRVSTDNNTSFVFFGDDGEGDLLTAKAMISNPKVKPHVSAVMIHCLDNCLQRIDEDPIYYFQNYAQATLKLYESGLIKKESAQRVLKSIQEDSFYKQCQTPQFSNIVGCQKMKTYTELLLLKIG